MRRPFYYSFLIFIFSIVIGLYYSIKWKNNISKENMSNEVIQETGYQEVKLDYDSNLYIKKYYSKCGHISIVSAEMPVELINMSRDEIEETFPNWKVEEFSKNEVILAKRIDEFCEEHYVVKMDDNFINVYHQKKPNDLEFYKTTNISTEYLEEDDRKKLENGIYIYGKNSLNSTIEDFE